MSAERATAPAVKLRLFTALALSALAVFAAGCGGDDAHTTPSGLEKPALAVPEGSLESTGSKQGSTGSTSGTSADDSTSSSDTSSSDAGADSGTGGAGTGTDTGGDGGGAGTGTGTGTGGAGSGGAAPGN